MSLITARMAFAAMRSPDGVSKKQARSFGVAVRTLAGHARSIELSQRE